MSMPILRDHDHRQVIGLIEFKTTKLLVRLLKPVSSEEFFAIFGAVGMKPLNPLFRDGTMYFKEAEIYEFSLSNLGNARK